MLEVSGAGGSYAAPAAEVEDLPHGHARRSSRSILDGRVKAGQQLRRARLRKVRGDERSLDRGHDRS